MGSFGASFAFPLGGDSISLPLGPLATPQGDGPIIVIIPTAINMCLAAAENITANLRVQQSASLELPSLYKRAFMVAHETDEIALVRR